MQPQIRTIGADMLDHLRLLIFQGVIPFAISSMLVYPLHQSVEQSIAGVLLLTVGYHCGLRAKQ